MAFGKPSNVMFCTVKWVYIPFVTQLLEKAAQVKWVLGATLKSALSTYRD